MESLISSVTTNKILLIIFILLASLIIYAMLKRLIKIIVILLIALMLYAGYMNYKGENIDATLQKFLNRNGFDLKKIEQQKKKLSNAIDSVNEAAK